MTPAIIVVFILRYEFVMWRYRPENKSSRAACRWLLSPHQNLGMGNALGLRYLGLSGLGVHVGFAFLGLRCVSPGYHILGFQPGGTSFKNFQVRLLTRNPGP